MAWVCDVGSGGMFDARSTHAHAIACVSGEIRRMRFGPSVGSRSPNRSPRSRLMTGLDSG